MILSEAEKEAFFDAIYDGDCDRVELLLSQGVTPNLINRHNESALFYAALQGEDACVAALLAHGANTDKLPMVAAAIPHNPAVMRRFLTMGGDPNDVDAYGQTPLMEAANYGGVETVKLLLQHGADVNQVVNGMTAADVARKHGHTDVVAALQEA